MVDVSRVDGTIDARLGSPDVDLAALNSPGAAAAADAPDEAFDAAAAPEALDADAQRTSCQVRVS
jgi:hypothetical protein